MMSLFLYNRDTDVVSELLDKLETGAKCFKLEIKDGQRVKRPGALFVAGREEDNQWIRDESKAWEYVEKIAARDAGNDIT